MRDRNRIFGTIRIAPCLGAIALLSMIFTDDGMAQAPTELRVNTFPNAKALALHSGIANGIFERRGFKIDLHLTPNSKSQREGLAAGKFDIVHSAVDNALAMIEVAKQDVVIVTGGDSGMNEFFVQPEIKSFADLRGRTLVVDAPDTAYALQAKKILLQHGLKEGADYTVKPVGAGVYRFKAMEESKDNAAGDPQPAVHRAGGGDRPARASDGPSTCSVPTRRKARSCCAPGRATTARCSSATSRPMWRRCALCATRKTGPAASRCWSRSSSFPRRRPSGPTNSCSTPASATRRTPSSTRRASRTCWRCGARFSAGRAMRRSIRARYIDLGYYERAMKLFVTERVKSGQLWHSP